MGKLLAFIKTPKGIASLFFALTILIAIPLTVFLVQNRQTLEQSAHTPSPSVTTVCRASEVVISYTYTISGLPSGVTANVSVSDSQHLVTDNFTFTNSSAPYSKQVGTARSIISAGVLTFQTTATDGFKKTNQVGYPAAGPCAGPTNTPTPPILTLTPTPTIPECGTESTPACVTPEPSNSPTPVPTDTPTPSDTPVPTDTPMPSVTVTVTDTPTPSSTPTIVVTSDTPTPTSEITDTPTPTVVPSATVTLLPTGPNGIVSIGFIGFVLLLIGGLLIFAL